MTKMFLTTVLPGERFVTGPFGDVGYIAKRPGHGAYVEKLLKSRAKNRATILEAKEKIRDSKKVAVLNEFYQRLEKVSLRASVNRTVELGVQEEDDYFKIKQNKLRQLLLEDQSRFVEEYTIKAQTSTEEMLAREKQKADEVVKGESNEGELRAQQIYAEMAMKSSDEFKQKLRIANMKHESEGRREQIRVKKHQTWLGQEEDAIWDAIRKEDCKKTRLQKEREDDAAAERKREMLEFLNKQVMDEELSRRKNLCIEGIEDEQNEEIRRKWEEQFLKRDEEALRRKALYHEALMKQIETNRLLAERNQEEELRIERIMQEDKRKKAEREAAAYEMNKIGAWDELVVFKEAKVQYRKAAAVIEEEAARLYEERQKMSSMKIREARLATEKASKSLRANCVETSKRMVLEKAKKEVELKARDLKLRDLALCHEAISDRLNASLEQRNALDRRAYNNAQSRYMSLLENRQKLEDEEMLEKMRILSEENSRKVKASLDRPMAELEGTSLHPFYKVTRAHAEYC